MEADSFGAVLLLQFSSLPFHSLFLFPHSSFLFILTALQIAG